MVSVVVFSAVMVFVLAGFTYMIRAEKRSQLEIAEMHGPVPVSGRGPVVVRGWALRSEVEGYREARLKELIVYRSPTKLPQKESRVPVSVRFHP